MTRSMHEGQKFYVTPTRLLDTETVADVQYFPIGTRKGADLFTEDGPKPNLRQNSEFHLCFKDQRKASIFLVGEEADTAWFNFLRMAGSRLDRSAK